MTTMPKKDMPEDNSKTVDLVLSLLQLILILVLLIWAVLFTCSQVSSAQDDAEAESTIRFAVVTDLYKQGELYFMDVVPSADKQTYTIEISKSDFMAYKQFDVIQILFDGTRVRLVTDNVGTKKSL